MIAYINGCPALGIQSIQERNPFFYYFNIVIHQAECTPHAHLDYIAYGDNCRGIKKQINFDKALRANLEHNGIATTYKNGKHINGMTLFRVYRERERDILRQISEFKGMPIKDKDLEIRGGHRAVGGKDKDITEYRDDARMVEPNEALEEAQEEIAFLKNFIGNLLSEEDMKCFGDLVYWKDFEEEVEISNQVSNPAAAVEAVNSTVPVSTKAEIYEESANMLVEIKAGKSIGFSEENNMLADILNGIRTSPTSKPVPKSTPKPIPVDMPKPAPAHTPMPSLVMPAVPVPKPATHMRPIPNLYEKVAKGVKGAEELESKKYEKIDTLDRHVERIEKLQRQGKLDFGNDGKG